MGNTFSCQKELPIMPVPNLNKTCRKLIEWAEPLLTEEERTRTGKVIEQFLQPGGEGEVLQNELIEWANRHGHANWSAPVWQALYLESRAPLVINSNVFYYLKSKLDENACSQANIAAALIVSVYNFISLIDKKELTVDLQKGMPLCMNQYSNLFSSTRIAQQGTDEFKVSSSRKHIVVMHNMRIYKINILDEKGCIRSPSEIESDLGCILSISGKGQNVGVLTTMPRDTWAENRAALLQLSANNREAMTAIEEAAFALCLDENSPEEITEVSKQLLYGDGKDRFFDKSLQFIVFKNGKTGVNFEHTGVDGSVMLRLIGYIYDTVDKVSFGERAVSAEINRSQASRAEEIEFDLDGALTQTICAAADAFCQHTANTQTRVLNFTLFGKDQIKQFGVSPDAFVQVALQLAEHQLYGKCYSAYEAVMTRTFLDGRIDVLYTVSPESMAFIQNIRDPDCSEQAKIDSLIQATRKHVERAKECRLGHGVYTHLLALKYRYKAVGRENGIDTLPEIFTDKGYQTLTHSVVCTSTTSEYGVELAGYGPIVDDGYGIRYFTRNDSICFNMTSRTDMQDKLEQMRIYIEQSLVEMADLMRS
ncbi:choline/carnitine O-acyltransferase [Photobacterium sp. SDRW27]|uniref:choline/carnitine O-acyltransferase n=1 Tax=Photobacterium obscurum TaxID=2829490 RepID=UPI0022437F6A|nr:choline/carnitine O-acyltransferase [Photobacterium obscurum]MCW8331380.1 choline/carnitine O-acyltransferase [Photobacterium obscurum]